MSSETKFAVPVMDLIEGTTKYQLNEELLSNILLDSRVADKKVCIISVAGAFRKGKSFLLNFFVHYLEWLESGKNGEWLTEDMVLDKFHWRSGLQRDTVGILLWNKPYVRRDNNNEEVVVLFMDTQGLFDNKSTLQQCVTVFAMSTLISSCQIFNISQQIQENDLQHLRFFTEYAKLVEKGSDTAAFQELLFLVRDWQNSDEHSFGYVGGNDYLETLLDVTEEQEAELQEVRQNLKSSFSIIKSFLMPYPGKRITQNNSEKVLGEISVDFKEQIELFVPSVFEKMDAKRVNGQAISCADVYRLFKSYMDVFKSEEMPQTVSIFEAMNVAAEDSARVEYNRAMDELLAGEPDLYNHETLQHYQHISKDCALKVFEEKPKFGGAGLIDKHTMNLLNSIQKRFDELSQLVELRRQAKEEEDRIAEERRRIEEEERRLEEERRRQEELQKRIEEERALEEEERRRRVEYQRMQQAIAEENIRAEQLRLEQERIRAEEERQRMEKEQEEMRRQIEHMANRPPVIHRRRRKDCVVM